MRRSRDPPDRLVVCPACGQRVARANAREYDKYGNRWDRGEKTFEYVCRDCHDELSLQARDDLEALLCDVEAGDVDRQEFLRRYAQSVERRNGRPEEG